VGGKATLAAGLTQQPDQLGWGQPGRVGGGGGSRQQRAGLGPQDPTAGGANAASNPGSYSRSSDRSLLWAWVRSQTASCWARASTAIARTSSESVGSGRWATRSVRKMLASTTASAWSDFLPETAWRSR
jgi:hypothetical protein